MTGLFFIPAAASRQLPGFIRRRSRRTAAAPGEAGLGPQQPGRPIARGAARRACCASARRRGACPNTTMRAPRRKRRSGRPWSS
jgi:hypothetical protein